jgi:hypothetical protein
MFRRYQIVEREDVAQALETVEARSEMVTKGTMTVLDSKR